MNCEVYLDKQIVVRRGSKLEKLYFVLKGTGAVIRNRTSVAFLSDGSWFGDYQAFLGVCSNFTFANAMNDRLYLITLDPDYFIQMCKNH